MVFGVAGNIVPLRPEPAWTPLDYITLTLLLLLDYYFSKEHKTGWLSTTIVKEKRTHLQLECRSGVRKVQGQSGHPAAQDEEDGRTASSHKPLQTTQRRKKNVKKMLKKKTLSGGARWLMTQPAGHKTQKKTKKTPNALARKRCEQSRVTQERKGDNHCRGGGGVRLCCSISLYSLWCLSPLCTKGQPATHISCLGHSKTARNDKTKMILKKKVDTRNPKCLVCLENLIAPDVIKLHHSK